MQSRGGESYVLPIDLLGTVCMSFFIKYNTLSSDIRGNEITCNSVSRFDGFQSQSYMYKLYHTTSGISLLLHDAEAKPKQSVNNNDIPQV